MRDLRGNVPTRIDALVRGEYNAIVLAHAGLLRLGRLEHVRTLLDTDVMLPAPGQGAIAVQARAGDGRLADLLAALDDEPTRLATEAERAVLARIEGGCQVPLGALARVDGDRLALMALVADPDGAALVRHAVEGRARTVDEAAALGDAMADALLSRGGRAILERVRAAAPGTFDDQGTDMGFPTHRARRLRRTETIRRMTRETRLSPDDLVAPLFVCAGEGVRTPIEAMPGCSRMSPDLIVEECRVLASLGVPA